MRAFTRRASEPSVMAVVVATLLTVSMAAAVAQDAQNPKSDQSDHSAQQAAPDKPAAGQDEAKPGRMMQDGSMMQGGKMNCHATAGHGAAAHGKPGEQTAMGCEMMRANANIDKGGPTQQQPGAQGDRSGGQHKH